MKLNLTKLQYQVLKSLRERTNYGTTASLVLANITETSSIAVYQACRALERKQLVLHHPPKDRYACHRWSISKLGSEILEL